jgi:hypothetical protein
MSVAWMEESQAVALKPAFVKVDERNKILAIRNGVPYGAARKQR